MSDEVIVKVEIFNKIYPISCKEGEEDRVRRSAELLSKTIKELDSSNSDTSENRLLVMAGLILSDKINLQQDNDIVIDTLNLNEMIKWLEKSSARLNNVARLLDES